jgi:teichuronic acid biosynthesis glycosyltransferase TuaC
MNEATSAAEISPSDGRSRLHVLTLTPFYPSEHDDARGCFVAEPLAALAKQGVSNTVIAAQPFYRPSKRPHPDAQPAEFLRYFSLPGGVGLSSAGAFLLARLVSRIREVHRARKIDVIHAHAPLPCGHAAMLLSKELNVSYVVSVHGLDAYSTNQVHGAAGEWCRRLTQRVFRSARRVICISEHVRAQVLVGARDLRTSIVYNGVDPDAFSPADPTPPNPPAILSVGNLIPIKGHELLIRAVSAIGASHPDLTLDIVGDGPERARLAALAAELALADRVRFLGRQSRRDVARLLRSSTLFALPSRYEGLGCVYLEAMSSGKAAIGCRGQGIEEVIRHGSNGWLVGADNVEELAAALSTLLSNTLLREFIAGQARQTILNGFTLAHQADHLRRIYQECAG